jgi:hypothetical protein
MANSLMRRITLRQVDEYADYANIPGLCGKPEIRMDRFMSGRACGIAIAATLTGFASEAA